jgi:hypothetical protein
MSTATSEVHIARIHSLRRQESRCYRANKSVNLEKAEGFPMETDEIDPPLSLEYTKCLGLSMALQDSDGSSRARIERQCDFAREFQGYKYDSPVHRGVCAEATRLDYLCEVDPT